MHQILLVIALASFFHPSYGVTCSNLFITYMLHSNPTSPRDIYSSTFMCHKWSHMTRWGSYGQCGAPSYIITLSRVLARVDWYKPHSVPRGALSAKYICEGVAMVPMNSRNARRSRFGGGGGGGCKWWLSLEMLCDYTTHGFSATHTTCHQPM
jgi:hypothetical protein